MLIGLDVVVSFLLCKVIYGELRRGGVGVGGSVYWVLIINGGCLGLFRERWRDEYKCNWICNGMF